MGDSILSRSESVATDVASDLLKELQQIGLKGRWAVKPEEIKYHYGKAPIASGKCRCFHAI